MSLGNLRSKTWNSFFGRQPISTRILDLSVPLGQHPRNKFRGYVKCCKDHTEMFFQDHFNKVVGFWGSSCHEFIHYMFFPAPTLTRILGGRIP
jgi:hypothetical protein